MSSIEPSNVDFKALSQIILDRNEKPAVRRSNKKDRVDSWNGSLETLPPEKAEQLVKVFNGFLEEKFGTVLEEEKPRILSEIELSQLASELEDANLLQEVALSVKERAKRLAFGDMNESKKQGNPRNRIDDPDSGKSFTRRGEGFSEPVADWSKLNTVLSPEQLAGVVTNTYDVVGLSEDDLETIQIGLEYLEDVEIVSHMHVDIPAVMKIVMSDKSIEKKFAKILKQGTYSPGSFYFIDTPKDES